jgi:hypothetical protein
LFHSLLHQFKQFPNVEVNLIYLGNEHEVGERVHGRAEVVEIEHFFAIQIEKDVPSALFIWVELLD